MKLKKIASLALAGIMAVSMLAGCGDTDKKDPASSGEQNTVTSSFASTVLEKTNATTQALLKAGNNSKLADGIEYAAKTVEFTEANRNAALNQIVVLGNDSAVANAVSKYVVGNSVNYTTGDWNQFTGVSNLANNKNSGTYYQLYYTAGTASDEWIANSIADKIDEKVEVLTESTDSVKYEYTLDIAKATVVAGNSADRADDCIIIGVAVSVKTTKVEY